MVSVSEQCQFVLCVDTVSNVATLTCGSGTIAGSGMVGTDPFTRVSVEAKQLCTDPRY